jgi:O-antigen ligase
LNRNTTYFTFGDSALGAVVPRMSKTPAVNATSSLAGRIDHLIRLVVLVGAVITPIAFSTTVFDAFRLPKELALYATAILLLALWVIRIAFTGSWHYNRLAPEFMLSAAGSAWFAVCVLLSTNRLLSLNTVPWFISGVLVILVTAAFGGTRSWRLLPWILAPALVNSATLVFQVFRGWDVVVPPEGTPTRNTFTAFVGNPDDLGSYLVVPMLVGAALALTLRRHRTILGCIWVFLLLSVVLTQTVTALLASAAALIAMALQWNRRAAVAVIVGLTLLLTAMSYTYVPLRVRLERGAAVAAAGDLTLLLSGRPLAFVTAIEMFKERPLTGVGPGCFAFQYLPYRLRAEQEYPSLAITLSDEQRVNYGSVHNDHLQLLAETGLPGYAIFIAAGIFIASLSWRRRETVGAEDRHRQMIIRLLPLPLVIAFFVTALGQFPLHIAATLYPYAFVAGICIACKDEQQLLS